ncbi:MAG: hypothetical protein PUC06_01835 [Oscillospiraceae bacterium]|nr:hypothetical protein [Oscillospiraceae bacterium]
MKDQHFTSRMLTCAGALMTISAILMAICSGIAYGGVLLASASCMFFAARHFRMAENRKADENHHSEEKHEP